MKEVNFSDVGGDQKIVLFECSHCFNPAKTSFVSLLRFARTVLTYSSVILCTKGRCLPGFGVAFATDSIAGVHVAVNRQVCRSLGRASNRYDRSAVKVEESSRSASSRTYFTRIRNRARDPVLSAHQEFDFREIPVVVSTL